MTDAVARLTSVLADRYRLERELGAGGMAVVYLAQDLKHDRDDLRTVSGFTFHGARVTRPGRSEVRHDSSGASI